MEIYFKNILTTSVPLSAGWGIYCQKFLIEVSHYCLTIHINQMSEYWGIDTYNNPLLYL